MGIEDRDWYRERQRQLMQDHYYSPRALGSHGGLGPADSGAASWFWPKWWYLRGVVEALIAPAIGAVLVLVGPCLVGWLMFRTDPRVAAWQFAQMLVSLNEGRWFVFGAANLAIAGVVITVMKRWMRPISAGGGVVAALAWIALPASVMLYGVAAPMFLAHGFSMSTFMEAPTVLVSRIASTRYAVLILMGIAVYGVWGAALWMERVYTMLKGPARSR